MDSFLSLFDPSDGVQKTSKRKPEQDNVKKKGDTPKGRRRGRRCQGKNETLPEESSFLCEPQLSTELLVKDGSYIESYFELKRDTEPKSDADKKPKRRNSSRKNRRKKKTPPKDILNTQDTTEPNWNNMNQTNQIKDENNLRENIGKNVNDLKNLKIDQDFKFKDIDAYNVIDKLEKVGLKDDMYLAGDFNTEELENDFVYSSDDMDESFDDTTSEPDDSSEEAYGSLPPEPRFGNVEYKLQLVAPCEKRFQHLVTQLKWRLRSGGGSAVYVLGVRDCGSLVGLRARALRASLASLRRMASAIGAALAHVTARRVAPQRAVAEVYIRKLADTQQSVELRVAVLGANEAGKSTLIGVLTQGELDNGRGSARLNMFRHLHEVKSGRTSSLSHEILGFDAQGNVVNYGCSELMTAERIGERSAKLVSFIDLAGHTKYQRTTLHGLTGYCPHYAMLVISCTAGITAISEEHLSLLLALDVPLCFVLTKCELAPGKVNDIARRLDTLLASEGKKCQLITDENLARNCVAPQKLILDTLDKAQDKNSDDEKGSRLENVPVFPVSCVRGVGLNALHAYLLALQPPEEQMPHTDEQETCEFQIDEIFHVGDTSGPVVGGLLARGTLYEGDQLIIGPLESGAFIPTSVKTIYRNRVPTSCVRKGQSASLGLLVDEGSWVPRPGMVLLAKTAEHQPNRQTCDNSKNRKNVRRKNQNILQDIAKVENSLIKDDCIENNNIYNDDKIDNNKKTLKSDKKNLHADKKTQQSDKTMLHSDEKTLHCDKKMLHCDNQKLHFDNETLHSDNPKLHSDKKMLHCDNQKLHSDKRTLHSDNKTLRSDNTTLQSDTTTLKSINQTQETNKNTSNLQTENKKLKSNENERTKTLQSDIETLQTDIKTLESDIRTLENIKNVQDVNDNSVTEEENTLILEDPDNPRGCIYFQATVRVLRHATAIYPGFQCTVHVGNVRQTAIIEGILSVGSELRSGESASVVFRFSRCPEYIVRGRRMLFTAGLGTRAIGRVTQVFPYFP